MCVMFNALSEALRMFKEKSAVEMAKCSGAHYSTSDNKLYLKYLNSPIEVDYLTGEITSQGLWKLTQNDKVLILQYLVFSCGVKPRESWITFLQLPDGPHHHALFVSEAIKPLAERFGQNLNEFKNQLSLFGAEEISLGHCGVVVTAFPNIPLAIGLWQGDDEFEANANILFDITAPMHLSTAALWVLGIEMSHKLRNTVCQQFINEQV